MFLIVRLLKHWNILHKVLKSPSLEALVSNSNKISVGNGIGVLDPASVQGRG